MQSQVKSLLICVASPSPCPFVQTAPAPTTVSSEGRAVGRLRPWSRRWLMVREIARLFFHCVWLSLSFLKRRCFRTLLSFWTARKCSEKATGFKRSSEPITTQPTRWRCCSIGKGGRRGSWVTGQRREPRHRTGKRPEGAVVCLLCRPDSLALSHWLLHHPSQLLRVSLGCCTSFQVSCSLFPGVLLSLSRGFFPHT